LALYALSISSSVALRDVSFLADAFAAGKGFLVFRLVNAESAFDWNCPFDKGALIRWGLLISVVNPDVGDTIADATATVITENMFIALLINYVNRYVGNP
jgi:hypothetical protein